MKIVSSPWYRQFWPWLLFGLPASAVLGCIVTIWLVLAHPDREVALDKIPVNAVLGTNSVVPPRK